MTIHANAVFDKHMVAHLGDYDGESSLELHRRCAETYELTVYWRREDLTFCMTRAQLKSLGQALVRLADVQFIDG
jgi:tryptophan synthase beta subunit